MTVKKWFVGFVLAVVMVTALGINAILFSARDFQFALAQISPETNGLISVSELLAADEQINRIQQDSAGPRGELLQIQSDLAGIDAHIATAQSQINEERVAIVGGVADIETRTGVAAIVEGAAGNIDTAALNSRVVTLAGASGLSAADQQALATLRTQVSELASREQALDTRDAERQALVARERLVGGQVAEADRRVFALQQSVVPNYEHYPRIRSEVLALRNMSPMGIGSLIAQGHPAFVSTILVLLMGALGAILYLFPAYLTRPEPVTFAEIIVRLIFGMCAALAFYVIANATIAGFSLTSDVRQATSSATLNPFTVSLIGIVAGVMAEDIAKWIQDRGKGVFTQAGGGAPAASTAPRVDTAEDAGFTGVNPHGGPGAP